MSWKYRKDKPDAVTEDIVSGLRKIGYEVIPVGRPTDLLVRHTRWPLNVFKMLECKTRKLKNGQVVLDKRQKTQQEFCAKHGVPYVTSLFEARLALGEVIRL
jgi:hypothetical protein